MVTLLSALSRVRNWTRYSKEHTSQRGECRIIQQWKFFVNGRRRICWAVCLLPHRWTSKSATAAKRYLVGKLRNWIGGKRFDANSQTGISGSENPEVVAENLQLLTFRIPQLVLASKFLRKMGRILRSGQTGPADSASQPRLSCSVQLPPIYDLTSPSPLQSCSLHHALGKCFIYFLHLVTSWLSGGFWNWRQRKTLDDDNTNDHNHTHGNDQQHCDDNCAFVLSDASCYWIKSKQESKFCCHSAERAQNAIVSGR